MNARAQQAHSAQQALANLRAQNPQLGHKLHLASAQPEQLALFAMPQTGRPKQVSLGLKDHDWDQQRPVSKTVFSVVLLCKRCGAQIRLTKGARAQYGVQEKQRGQPIVLWSAQRPVCAPREAAHG